MEKKLYIWTRKTSKKKKGEMWHIINNSCYSCVQKKIIKSYLKLIFTRINYPYYQLNKKKLISNFVSQKLIKTILNEKIIIISKVK